MKNSQNLEIQIVNQLGQNISEYPNPITSKQGKTINLELRQGVYIAWLIINGERVSEQKIIVIE